MLYCERNLIIISVVWISAHSSRSCRGDVTFPRSIPRQRRDAIRPRSQKLSARARCEASERCTSGNQSGFSGLEFRDRRLEQDRRGVPFGRTHADPKIVHDGLVRGRDDLAFHASLYICRKLGQPNDLVGTTWDPHATGHAVLSNGHDRTCGE